MAALKDIRIKIGGVRKTKQITKAMNMVASAKLRGAQARIERFRPYAAKFHDILKDLAGKTESGAHPLLTAHEEPKVCVIILITSDRGLCGSFNTNLLAAANRLAGEKTRAGMTVKYVCIGRKGRDFARKAGCEALLAYGDKMGNFDFSLAHEVGTFVVDGYRDFEMDEVHLIYGEFVSIARQAPVSRLLLPLQTPEADAESASAGLRSEYVYEPQEDALLAELLPRYVKVQIYRGMLDTSCSEHAARMAAMDNATRNCDEMIHSLTRLFNKVRQAGITSDLMDIVGGAEALKG
jgi:F-type H+-transporting ATPase subunit gamma